MWNIICLKLSWEMNLGCVKPVGVAQLRIVKSNLLSGFRGELSIVNWELPMELKTLLIWITLENSGKTHFKKWELQPGLRLLILRIYGVGHRQTMKNIGLSSSVLPYVVKPYSNFKWQCNGVTVNLYHTTWSRSKFPKLILPESCVLVRILANWES